MKTTLDYLCMSQGEAVKFLDDILEAQSKVNRLTGIAQTRECWGQLYKAYMELDELLSPFCSDCKVRAKRFITSDAELYDPALADLPGGTTRYWTGEWYCPKCKHLVAVGRRWWQEQRSKAEREVGNG